MKNPTMKEKKMIEAIECNATFHAAGVKQAENLEMFLHRKQIMLAEIEGMKFASYIMFSDSSPAYYHARMTIHELSTIQFEGGN